MSGMDELCANLRILEDMLYRACELAPDVAKVSITANLDEGRVDTWVFTEDGSQRKLTEWGLADAVPF